ncbi:hypothetical protein [Jeotgalibacillus marinus]|uniref:Fibronectin type-III domain-containing protein n=1 Tax=Jeotgalibacillus marinus TaxID=86667 RepID=A0ABV3Q600_9BACL
MSRKRLLSILLATGLSVSSMIPAVSPTTVLAAEEPSNIETIIYNKASNASNASNGLLPLLEDVLPVNSYNMGLPKDTYPERNLVESDLLDFVGIELYGSDSFGDSFVSNMFETDSGKHYDGGEQPSVTQLANGIVLEVHNGGGNNNLYYNLGKYKEDGTMDWWEIKEKQYNNGDNPSVTLLANGDVLEVHNDGNKLYYNIGKYKDDRTMDWNGEGNQYGTGNQPSVTVLDTGEILEVHNDGNDLYYNLGKYKDDGTMDWYSIDNQYDTGEQPSVTVLDTGEILEVHSDGNDLYYKLGVYYGSNKITWYNIDDNQYTTGKDPSVTVLPNGDVLEIHNSSYGSSLIYDLGVYVSGKIIWYSMYSEDSLTNRYDHGYKPTVIVLENERILEVHNGSGNNSLYYNLGTGPRDQIPEIIDPETGKNVVLGFMDDSETVRDKLLYNDNDNPDKYIGTLMIDPNSSFAQGTKLAFEGYWNLISPSYLSTAGNSIERSVSYTSGVSVLESQLLAKTVGYTQTYEIGFLSVKNTQAFNQSVTNTFQTSISVTEETSSTDKYSFGDYSEGQAYIAGVYQLVGNYYMIPGDNIQDLKDKVDEWGKRYEGHDLFGYTDLTSPYNYRAESFASVEVKKIDPEQYFGDLNLKPTNIQSHYSSQGVEVTWDNPESEIDKYAGGVDTESHPVGEGLPYYTISVYRDGEWIGSSSISGTSYTIPFDPDDNADTLYQLRLGVYGGHGEMYSLGDPVKVDKIDQHLEDLNLKPTNIQSDGGSQGVVEITWDNPESEVVKYFGEVGTEEHPAGEGLPYYGISVYRDGEWIGGSSASGTSYTIPFNPDDNADTLYQLRLGVYEGYGEQVYLSDPVKIQVDQIDPDNLKPTNIQSHYGSQGVEVTWDNPESDILKYFGEVDTEEHPAGEGLPYYGISVYSDGEWIGGSSISGASYTIDSYDNDKSYQLRLGVYEGYGEQVYLSDPVNVPAGSF